MVSSIAIETLLIMFIIYHLFPLNLMVSSIAIETLFIMFIIYHLFPLN